jgi:hypothetical protein
MAFSTLPHIIPRTELQAPTGPGSAEIASGDQIIAAIETHDITKLSYRQHSVLASAIAITRAAKTRARSLPTEAMVGNEMSRVLIALQSLSAEAIESLATALGSADERWAEQLSQGEAQPEA